jgi:CBS domain-containing protein
MQTVAEVMTPFARTVQVHQPIGAARDLMAAEALHAVPVVDASGALVGIVSSSDLIEGWAAYEGVDRVMRHPVHTVAPGTDVADAAHDMLAAGIHHLVVVEGDSLVGMLSSWDLLRTLAATVQRFTAAAAAAEVGPGDDLVVVRPGGALRGRIEAVRGASGRPPYAVTWYDDPDGQPHEVTVVHRDELVLDGCER